MVHRDDLVLSTGLIINNKTTSPSFLRAVSQRGIAELTIVQGRVV